MQQKVTMTTSKTNGIFHYLRTCFLSDSAISVIESIVAILSFFKLLT